MIIKHNWHLVLALLPALVNVGIALYIFLRLPKAKATTIFAYLVIALSIWQVQDVLFRAVTSIAQAQFIDHAFCIGWIAAGPLGFQFACTYTSQPIVNKPYFLWLTYLPFVLLQRLYVADHNVELVYHDYWGWISTPDSSNIDGMLRFLISVLMMIVVFVLLRHAYKKRNDKDIRVQALLIAIGIFIPTVTATITQVAFPLIFNRDEVPISSLLMSFFSLGTVVALNRYRLFDIAESIAVESVLQNLKNMVLVVSPDGHILYLNPFAARLFNCSVEGNRTLLCSSLFASPASYAEFHHTVVAPALTGQPVLGVTTQLYTPDNTRVVVQINAEAVLNNNNVIGILIVGSDITTHVRMFEELKVVNERYDLVSRATNDMVWDWDLLNGIVYRSREGWFKIFQEELENEFGTDQEWNDRLHPDDRLVLAETWKDIESGKIRELFTLEFRVVKKDGSLVHLVDRGYIIRNESGKPVRLIGAAQDVTLRKEAERHLHQAQLTRQKEITDAVIRAQENERRIIGAELHDNVNQILTSATLYLGLARSEQAGQERFFEQAGKMISRAMLEVRKLSHTLIPPTWSGETLAEALDHMLEAPQQAGLFAVEKDFDGLDEEAMPFKLKLNIYRIVQEQINNVTKHAQAATLRVRLKQHDGGIDLEIADDGVGFDPAAKIKGVGLANIEARALLHNGQVTLIAAPQAGCRLQVAFPASAVEAAVVA